MTPQAYSNRIKKLFCEAVDLPGHRVSDFLDSRCEPGDPDRSHIEALLGAHGRAGRFLDPVDDSAVLPAVPRSSNRVQWIGLGEQPGSVIDRYQLVEVLGEGGFGVVYRADQIRPIRRTVALKVIKSGSNSDAVLARFEVERQALASMNHPNIAGLIDAGTTETGKPYFVMELVDGPPITVYGKSARLTVAEVLTLFIPVCQAVHHAHQKGILHRDIKPSNILVDAVSGTARVIDFGIAKPITGDNASPMTEIGQRIGTPKYMSPEQSAGRRAVLDTRSDVYSLGAVLTEMLTAGEGPAATVKTLPRELRWVLRKATDAEQDRRYESATAFGDDLRNYLDGRPLKAGPAGMPYLARKFLGRHKIGTALATAAVLALVASLMALSVALVRVRASRDHVLLAERGRQAAELERNGKLRESLLMQARAGRRSGLPGQRIDSLSAIADAIKIGPGTDLRDEFIACLATPDVRLERVWKADPGWNLGPFSPSRDRFVEFDTAGKFQIVRTSDGQVIGRFPGESVQSPRDIEFSGDGNYLASNYTDNKVGLAVWDVSTGKCVVRVPGAWRCKNFAGDSRSIVVDSVSGDLNAFDLKTGNPLATLHTGGAVDHIRCQAGTDAIAVNLKSSGLWIMHLSEPARRKKIATSISGVFDMAWSPDGRRLAVCGGVPNTIEIYDAWTGKIQQQLQGHLVAVIQVCFADRGRLVVSTSWDGTVRVWDTGTGKLMVTCPGAGVTQNLDVDNSILLHPTKNTIEQWRLIPGSACVAYNGLVQDDFFEDSAFGPDGKVLVAFSCNGLCAWSTETGLPIGYLPIPTGRTPMFVEDGSRLLLTTAGGVREVPSANVANKDSPHLPNSSRGQTSAMDLNRNRTTLLFSDCDGHIFTAPVNKVSAKTEIGKASGSPRFMSLSPDGRWALSSCRFDDGAVVWDVLNHQLKTVLRRSRDITENGSVGFSVDGKIAVTSDQTAYYFWKVPEWTPYRKLDRGDAPGIGLVAFSHDGQMMAVSGSDHDVQLLNPRTGDCLATLALSTPRGTCQLKFSDDDTKLAICSFGGVLVWDIRQIRSALAAAGLSW